MMVRLVAGNVFDVAPVLDAVVILVDFKGSAEDEYCAYQQRFPKSYSTYKAACDEGRLMPGDLFCVKIESSNPHWILNLVSTADLSEKSKLEWIQSGLESLENWLTEKDVKRIAISFTDGCIKGLMWQEVSQCIENALGNVDCEVLVFEPA